MRSVKIRHTAPQNSEIMATERVLNDDISYCNYYGAPAVTRTRGTRIRNPLLYPPELRGHESQCENQVLRCCRVAVPPCQPQPCSTFERQHFLTTYISMKHERFKEFFRQGGDIRSSSPLVPFAGKYSLSNFGHRSPGNPFGNGLPGSPCAGVRFSRPSPPPPGRFLLPSFRESPSGLRSKPEASLFP